MQPASKLQISQDTFNQWVDRWRFTPAQVTTEARTTAKLGEIKIKLNNGKTILLSIKQQDPFMILLRNDEQIEYYFPKETGEDLLRAPF
jgi:hypothetical protein